MRSDFSLNNSSWVLLLPPAFRDGVHPYLQPPSGQFRQNRITRLRTDGVRRQESADTGPVVLKVFRVTGAPCSGNPMDPFLYISLSTYPLFVQRTCAIQTRVSKAKNYTSRFQLARLRPLTPVFIDVSWWRFQNGIRSLADPLVRSREFDFW